MMVWLFAVPSFSQVKIGLRGGVDVISMEFNSDLLSASNRAGFFVGPTLRISTPLPFLSVDASVLYSQRTLKVQEESITQKSVILPGNVRAGIHLLGAVGIFASAGPQLAFNLGSSTYDWSDRDRNDYHFALQDTKLSLNFGAGVQVGSHLEAAVYYNVPLGKTADFTWSRIGEYGVADRLQNAKSDMNAWSVSLTYIF